MLERADTPRMRSFVRSVLQGETLGVSIGEIMRDLATRCASGGGSGRGAGAEGADQDPLPAGLPDLPGDVRGPPRARGDRRRHRAAATAGRGDDRARRGRRARHLAPARGCSRPSSRSGAASASFRRRAARHARPVPARAAPGLPRRARRVRRPRARRADAWNLARRGRLLRGAAVRMRLEERALLARVPRVRRVRRDARHASCRAPARSPRPRAGTSVATLRLPAAAGGRSSARRRPSPGPARRPLADSPAGRAASSTLCPRSGGTPSRGRTLRVADRRGRRVQLAGARGGPRPVLHEEHARDDDEGRPQRGLLVARACVAPDGAVSQWSSARSITKLWAAAPTLSSPDERRHDQLSAGPVRARLVAGAEAPRATSSDRNRPGTRVARVTSDRDPGDDVHAPRPTGPGQTYYWGITPIDAAGNHGEPSAVRSFLWLWPSGTEPARPRRRCGPEIFDHRFAWDAGAGSGALRGRGIGSRTSRRARRRAAARTGLTTIGTSYSPAVVLQEQQPTTGASARSTRTGTPASGTSALSS